MQPRYNLDTKMMPYRCIIDAVNKVLKLHWMKFRYSLDATMMELRQNLDAFKI